jgi:hypothetical protein
MGKRRGQRRQDHQEDYINILPAIQKNHETFHYINRNECSSLSALNIDLESLDRREEMELFLFFIFATLIIFMTAYFLVKLFRIAYKKDVITVGKFRILSLTVIAIAVIITSIIPFVYHRLIGVFL